MIKNAKNTLVSNLSVVMSLVFILSTAACAYDKEEKQQKRDQQRQELQRRFEWWPTDAKPGPQKDTDRGGYWWWPTTPGQMRPWGNRGYVYVYKIIFDYKAEELPEPKPQELRPSLLIKKIIKNVKIYFDYNKSALRDDALKILKNAVDTLKRNPDSSILITGNCDIRGSENYNEKLGRERADTVKQFMLDKGVADERIRIVSRGKLDAVAHIRDLEGMQKDRNAQFMIADVEEVMIPYPGSVQKGEEIPVPELAQATQVEEGKYVVEEEKKVESEVQVSTKEYTIKKGDTLSKIAQEHLGKAYRWKYLYELNKDRIKNPNKLKTGLKITIPIE
jgi:outer membrane protein OmpA-like peptidoglycan-associated protein